MCDLDPKVKVIGKKAGICDGVPSTAALVLFLSMLFYFSCFYCCLLTFLEINFFKKNFQECYQTVKWFGFRSGQRSVGPDQGPNCLQRLSADDKSLASNELTNSAAPSTYL